MKTTEVDYKFKLLDYARFILQDAGYANDPRFEDTVFKLAERLHKWIKEDINEAK